MDGERDLEHAVAELVRKDEKRKLQINKLYEWKRELNGMIPSIRHSLTALPELRAEVREEISALRNDMQRREADAFIRIERVLTEIQEREDRISKRLEQREQRAEQREQRLAAEARDREQRIIRNATLLNGAMLALVTAIIIAALRLAGIG